MKRFLSIMMIISITALLCACSGLPVIPPITGSPGAATPQVSPTPQTAAPTSPGATATGLVAGETVNNPAAQNEKDRAMQRDIDKLASQSEEQQGQESNYKNQKKDQFLTVERVSAAEIKFSGKPQVFKGDYTGQFTQGKQYKYFEDASMGGKRYYNVKDNFGVWVVFQYTVDIGQYGSPSPKK